MQVLSLGATQVTRSYLIDLIYQIECKLKLAEKWRGVSYNNPHSLRESYRAIRECHRERRYAYDLALTAKFDLRDLVDEVEDMLIGVEE